LTNVALSFPTDRAAVTTVASFPQFTWRLAAALLGDDTLESGLYILREKLRAS
jgi:hypothetical protein